MRLAALLGLLAAPATAQECRLALVLAVDVSSSVDAAEDRLQRDGLAYALRSPAVREALRAGDPVALWAFEWSGSRAQAAILPGWVLLSDDAAVEAAAQAIERSTRSRSNLPTAVGPALAHAALSFREAPDCRARTIDVAGDGIHNEGFTPAMAYREFPAFEGVTVNALIVGGAGGEDAELVAWYQAEVLRGPGAFSVYTDNYDGYARAMEAKLLRELQVPAVGKRAW